MSRGGLGANDNQSNGLTIVIHTYQLGDLKMCEFQG